MNNQKNDSDHRDDNSENESEPQHDQAVLVQNILWELAENFV